jgi:hypothetical protein
MKKVAIGCAVVLALLSLVIGIGSYVAYSKAKQFVGGFAQLGELEAMNNQIRNRAEFRPPADGALSAAQVDRYVGVQRAMVASLGDRVRKLDDKYKQLSRDLETKGRDANLSESLGAWGDVIALIVDAKREQVTALNAAGLSLSEYEWIRAQALLALGYAAFGMNLEALASANPDAFGAAGTEAPEMQTLQRNREFLAPYEETAKEWLPLSFFGL